MEKRIKQDRQVFFWPKYVTAKDINDLIIDGFEPNKVNSFIDEHTHRGMKAALALADWRKC
jgi:hypothetical protein